MTWTGVAVGALLACGGKTGAPGLPSGPPEGTCSQNGGLWSCVADDAGASQDAGPVEDAGAQLLLSQCPSGVGSGSCTESDQTVGTNAPVHIIDGDCLECATNGLGVYWSCVGGNWEARGVYSCH
jgi:hypothetical protein